MAYAASYQVGWPASGTVYPLGFLIDNPQRETRQEVSEDIIPGTNDVVIDIMGKAVTKIRNRIALASFSDLQTLEGAVGTEGKLTYTEYPTGVHVLWVSLIRTQYIPRSGVHLCDVEFWLLA